MDFVYGKISQKAEKNQYFPGETETTSTELSNNKILVDVKNPLPESTSLDQNKILTVNQFGSPEWKLFEQNVSNNSLPAPESDAVALIGVDGEWRQQSGYGYETGALPIMPSPPLDGVWIGFYKAGDISQVPIDSSISATITCVMGTEPYTDTYDIRERQEGVYEAGFEGLIVYFIKNPNTTINLHGSNLYFDRPGIYFCRTVEEGAEDYPLFVSYLKFDNDDTEYTWDGEFGSITTIDEKFIPESVKLPTPENDGEALVSKGNEWSKQSGYGYRQKLLEAVVYGCGPSLKCVKISELPEIPSDLQEGDEITLWVGSNTREPSPTNKSINYLTDDVIEIGDVEGLYIVINSCVYDEMIEFFEPGVYSIFNITEGWLGATAFAFGADATEPLISYNVKFKNGIFYGDTVPFDEDYIPNTFAKKEEVETINNKVTSISSGSTDDEYPSAKAVYDAIEAAVARILGNR